MRNWMRNWVIPWGFRALWSLPFGIYPGVKADAWPGFDHATWREITQAQPLKLNTPQTGQIELAPLLMADAGTAISIPAEWEIKRARILATWQALLGEPTDLQRVAPDARIVERHEASDYTRIHLWIAADAEEEIPAYLFLPKPLPPHPVAAIIVLHQTVPQGKDEPAGINMTNDLNFAEDLARRGFVTLAYDAIGFGERIPAGTEPYTGAHDFYRRHPHWSYFGRMVWDFRQMIDYLETVEEVDGKRIGVIGHSHGSYGGVVGAAFDSRIAAVVSSCGINTLRADPSPERWSHATPLLPQLGYYVENIRQTPTDWHELMACIAPRPFYYYGTLEDDIFPNTTGLSEVFKSIRSVYRLYGMPDKLQLKMVPGAHNFPPQQQLAAYDWLEETLGLDRP